MMTTYGSWYGTQCPDNRNTHVSQLSPDRSFIAYVGQYSTKIYIAPKGTDSGVYFYTSFYTIDAPLVSVKRLVLRGNMLFVVTEFDGMQTLTAVYECGPTSATLLNSNVVSHKAIAFLWEGTDKVMWAVDHPRAHQGTYRQRPTTHLQQSNGYCHTIHVE